MKLRTPSTILHKHYHVGKNTQRLYHFPNKLSVSVIDYGYGGEKDLYEIMVYGKETSLKYRGISLDEDVIGHLSIPQVNYLLSKVAKHV
jgi:hypothetical protein